VRSRCQALHLPLPPVAEAEKWLAGQGIDDAAVMLAAAGGQPLAAKAWADDGIDAAAWTRLPAQVARGDAAGLQGWPVPRALDALLKLCHDALLAGLRVAPRYFPAVPAPPRPAPLHAWQRRLAEAARNAEHPLNAGLLVESLVLQGARALAGEADARTRSLHSAHD
jgi:DNA polymerase-3 subunit delta'